MKKIALHNLGCKVNSYELEVMQQMLQEKGYIIVPFDEAADIYIVNTCTVTNIADRKSRQMLHRAKQLNPSAVVVAVGCYVQTGREAVEKDESIDLAIGNNRKKDIAEILEKFLEERAAGEKNGAGEAYIKEAAAEAKTLHGATVPDINRTYEYEEVRLKRTAEHTRAYIKIQDGCNQFCSYCVIPYARGRVRSRRAEDILTEIKGLASAGFREVVLTGIHISSYGIDFDGEAWRQGKSVETYSGERRSYNGDSRLVDLIERIQEVEGLERIRLGSLEPRIVTEDTARRLAAFPKLCPHFHLSLQSGCDETLRRMNRHYTTGEYYKSVEYLRKYFQRPAITTDVIVGFPGETEEEFARTKDFLERLHLYEMHVFKYSKRAGTAAAVMPDQVSDEVKAKRSEELLSMERRQSEEFRRAYIGRKAEVLFEEIRGVEGELYLIGHTRDYVKVAVKLAKEGSAEAEVLTPNMVAEVPVKGFLTHEILM